MSSGGRVAAVTATVITCALFITTTFVGNDSWFPAAPFRMFATAAPSDGEIEILRVEAVTATGDRFLLTQDNSGVRPAEVEGHADAMARDPELVRRLGDGFVARHPHGPEPVAIEIIYTKLEVEDGSLTGQCREVVQAGWYSDGPVPPSDGSRSTTSCSRGITSAW